MKSIIIVAILFLVYVALYGTLQYYSRGACSINCSQLSNTIRSRTDNDNRFCKTAFPDDVSRGCAKEQCNVQVNANSVLANDCCEKDLCNSVTTSKLIFNKLFIIIGVLIWDQI
ncbi:unnamed protein product [Rotaria sordida]|uniref:Uncharacterized protein n=1 Tax=Rotaria sordida TaxID=392033 RepID=A0A814MCD9_9BILA|nr:unnamed protein product [Rotaria sordida]CAF1535343.1 unnamed protein product [Rotaria sordida]